jgi:hypothetical protein
VTWAEIGITRGSEIEGRTACGEWIKLVALGAPTQGRDFPIVWVCTPEEYAAAKAEDREPDGLPWPLDAVQEPP